LSKKGYLSRVEKDDIIVAMNPSTLAREISYLNEGGVLLLPDDFKVSDIRQDIVVYPMPVKKLIREADVTPALRDYIANMVYVGVLSWMLGIDLELVRSALDFHFKSKKKAVDANFNVIQAAFDWATANLTKQDHFRVEQINGVEGMIMSDGNTAAALGSIYGGVQLAAWYPITPATSLAETLNEYLPELRKDPQTGKDTCVVVQAEDELAAIGMAIGAGWGGLRSMTSTSGPGLSLMSEYIGLAYYAEVPVVIWDVQRVGPSTGMPTRTAQGDLTMVNFISHGDTQMIILIPGSVAECFEFGWRAFDIAERLQTPVIVLSDLDFGMNQWLSPKFVYPDVPMDRGKVLWEDDLEAKIKEWGGNWGRYLDVDGDGIPYRTLPGNLNPKSGYFARGTSHDEYAHYTEAPEAWERVFNRIARKFETALQYLPKPEAVRNSGAPLAILSSGSAHPAVIEALDMLEAAGLKCDYLRLRSIPFAEEVADFLAAHTNTFVVEANRDGQLLQLLTMKYPQFAERMVKEAHMDGLPLTAKWIFDQIMAWEKEK
jgi:2-oxoglutarate ferredoxin oxidoreductase subunit alpha